MDKWNQMPQFTVGKILQNSLIFQIASEASKNVAEKLFDCRKNCEYGIFLFVNIWRLFTTVPPNF